MIKFGGSDLFWGRLATPPAGVAVFAQEAISRDRPEGVFLIRNRQDYRFYVAADLASSGLDRWHWYYVYTHPVVNFQRLLRTVEYYENCRRDVVGRMWLQLLRIRFRKLSINLGFTVPRHVFGPGLSLAHYGSVIVNNKTKVGKNCRIHSDVNIGEGRGQVPVIGDNVYIGPGAKIFGGIRVGDNVAIGANAVVNRDVPSNVTVGGIPAKVIANKGSQELVIDGCRLAQQQGYRSTLPN